MLLSAAPLRAQGARPSESTRGRVIAALEQTHDHRRAATHVTRRRSVAADGSQRRSRPWRCRDHAACAARGDSAHRVCAHARVTPWQQSARDDRDAGGLDTSNARCVSRRSLRIRRRRRARSGRHSVERQKGTAVSIGRCCSPQRRPDFTTSGCARASSTSALRFRPRRATFPRSSTRFTILMRRPGSMRASTLRPRRA